MRGLFPDQNPPILERDARVDQACIWLLAVMDEDDKSRRFVASLLTYYLDRGYLSEKQMEGLRSVASKMIRRHIDGDLQCQGSEPATVQTLGFGNVIEFRAQSEDAEVIL